MPLELQIIRAREFVRLGAQGEFHFESTRAVLQTLADACRKRGIERALVDVRGSHSDLTPAELAGLVNAFSEVGFSKRLRLAVLHTGDQDYRAKLFASISELRGWTVHAFENFEEALGWLSIEEDAGGESAKAQHSVPIQSGQSPGGPETKATSATGEP